MDIPDLNWRDVLSVGAAVVSLTASALRLYDRREERREQRRRAEAHRRAVDELTPDPDQAEDTEPAGPDHDGPDHDSRPRQPRLRRPPRPRLWEGPAAMTSTDTTPDGEAPGTADVDARGEDPEVDLDEVVAVLAAMGVDAVVEQTGGGCATIHAGPTRPHPDEPDTVAFAAVAGPGRYGWGRRPSIADLTDFYVGPDDCGQTRPTEAWPVGARDATAVARLIAEQTSHPERPATDAELRAAGFDPAPARVARERRATLGARWHPPVPADGPADDDTVGGMVVAEQLVTAAVENGALRIGVYVAATDTVEFGNGDGGDCVPVVLEVEGQVVFSLDDRGRATLHGSAATGQGPRA